MSEKQKQIQKNQENETQDNEKQDNVKEFKFGDTLPYDKPEYDTEFLKPVVTNGEYKIMFDKIDEREQMKFRTIPLYDEEGNKKGSYKRVGLILTDKADSGKPYELQIPMTVYNGIQDCVEMYKDKVNGVLVKVDGEGKKTKYKILPLLAGL